MYEEQWVVRDVDGNVIATDRDMLEARMKAIAEIRHLGLPRKEEFFLNKEIVFDLDL